MAVELTVVCGGDLDRDLALGAAAGCQRRDLGRGVLGQGLLPLHGKVLVDGHIFGAAAGISRVNHLLVDQSSVGRNLLGAQIELPWLVVRIQKDMVVFPAVGAGVETVAIPLDGVLEDLFVELKTDVERLVAEGVVGVLVFGVAEGFQ